MTARLRIGDTDIDPGRVDAVEITQTIEAQADTLVVEMSADGAVIPPSGVRAEAWLGGAYMGGYVVSDLAWRTGRSGRSVDVIATGADLAASGLRTPATRARPGGLTLAGLVEQIASDHGYDARVHPDLAGLVLQHEDQITESDLAYVVRICDEHDVDVRFSAGFLLALPRTGETTVAGLPLSRTLGNFTNLEIRFSDRWDWGAWVARYYDYDQGRPVLVRIGVPAGPAYEVPGVQGSADYARAAAERARTRLAERAWVLRATTPGDPALIPHVRLELPAAALPEGIPAAWRIREAVHRADDAGFVTTIGATVPERPEERPEPAVESKVSFSNARQQDPNRDYARLVERPATELEIRARRLAAQNEGG